MLPLKLSTTNLSTEFPSCILKNSVETVFEPIKVTLELKDALPVVDNVPLKFVLPVVDNVPAIVVLPLKLSTTKLSVRALFLILKNSVLTAFEPIKVTLELNVVSFVTDNVPPNKEGILDSTKNPLVL